MAAILLTHLVLTSWSIWIVAQTYRHGLAKLKARVAQFVLGIIALITLSKLLFSHIFFTMNLASHCVFLQLPMLGIALAVTLRSRDRDPRQILRYRLFFALCSSVLIAVALEAFVREPTHLTIQRLELRSAKVQRNIRFAVLSDVQFDTFGPYEREAFRTMMAQHPDVILLPGDYIHSSSLPAHLRLQREANAFFRTLPLRAPLGVYAVEGNAELPGWEALFDGLAVHTYSHLRTDTAELFSITGMGLTDSFNHGLQVAPTANFHVAVGHGPDFSLGNIQADLLVAGHTHGGQVQLPWLGPIVTLSGVPRSWASGVTRLPGDRTLLVTRGVGMERGAAPRLRFLCYPEIVIIDVRPR